MIKSWRYFAARGLRDWPIQKIAFLRSSRSGSFLPMSNSLSSAAPSEPVLTGFKSGIGLVIIVDQVPKLLGLHIAKTGFFRDIAAVANHLPQASVATVTLSASLLILIYVMEKFAPRLPAQPPRPTPGAAPAVVGPSVAGSRARKTDVQHLDAEFLHQVKKVDLVFYGGVGNRGRLKTIAQSLVIQ